MPGELEPDSKNVRSGDLCGVPSEREECCWVNSQGCTLGWYALPRWGKGLAVSDPGLEGCGLGAKCGNRGQRTRRQSRRRTPLRTAFACDSIPFCFHVDLVFQSHALKRASHTSPGCKPWGAHRQHSSRSEGTPHSRVSRISIPPPEHHSPGNF